MTDIGHNSEHLAAFIERIERLEEVRVAGLAIEDAAA